jgi:hypothetical protein
MINFFLKIINSLSLSFYYHLIKIKSTFNLVGSITSFTNFSFFKKMRLWYININFFGKKNSPAKESKKKCMVAESDTTNSTSNPSQKNKKKIYSSKRTVLTLTFCIQYIYLFNNLKIQISRCLLRFNSCFVIFNYFLFKLIFFSIFGLFCCINIKN